MGKRIKVVVFTSCDEQFIERMATKDPFEYYQRVLKDAISSEVDLFDLENNKLSHYTQSRLEEVVITKFPEIVTSNYYTHKIVYTLYLGNFATKDDTIVTAIISRFGAGNCVIFNPELFDLILQ